jgi:hypothetical protein
VRAAKVLTPPGRAPSRTPLQPNSGTDNPFLDVEATSLLVTGPFAAGSPGQGIEAEPACDFAVWGLVHRSPITPLINIACVRPAHHKEAKIAGWHFDRRDTLSRSIS